MIFFAIMRPQLAAGAGWVLPGNHWCCAVCCCVESAPRGPKETKPTLRIDRDLLCFARIDVVHVRFLDNGREGSDLRDVVALSGGNWESWSHFTHTPRLSLIIRFLPRSSTDRFVESATRPHLIPLPVE